MSLLISLPSSPHSPHDLTTEWEEETETEHGPANWETVSDASVTSAASVGASVTSPSPSAHSEESASS